LYSEDTVKSYIAETCPANSGNNKNNNNKNNDQKSGSGDHGGGGNAYADVQGTNTYPRYGNIEGYGYSTEKCVCYTDGTGCDCDHQNEGYAVRNLATYGPAVVCLDASTWQDYTSGIITKESGCSSGFMDVNHCVQAVGYAYFSEEDEMKEGSGDKGGGKSGSGDQHGSKDANRVGYWIVRNQWSEYWGMNGYAYVAMGDNTCGILNDMLQAYT
jgi:cathepsin F